MFFSSNSLYIIDILSSIISCQLESSGSYWYHLVFSKSHVLDITSMDGSFQLSPQHIQELKESKLIYVGCNTGSMVHTNLCYRQHVSRYHLSKKSLYSFFETVLHGKLLISVASSIQNILQMAVNGRSKVKLEDLVSAI